MDKWKEDETFATWTPEEFNAKWNSFEKQELENKLIKIIKKEYKNLNDINEDFDSMVEKIVKTLLQNYHDLLYREKYIIKDKLKLK